MYNKLLYIALLLVMLTACKKPFKASLTTTVTNYLAVDGAIISGDSTFITLSRTTALSDTTQNKVELKAVLSVEDDKGTLYAFTEKGKGVYTLGVTNFSTAHQYRLDIKTNDGKIYRSDFVPMKITPPIDSLYFKQNSDATVLFYVDAHDATNSTRYYRWDYKETWSYVALYPSYYHYSNGYIYNTTPNSPDDISVCYRTGQSNQIFIGSSAKTTKDIITDQQLGGLAAGSEKIGHVYVMQLRQYALTQDGFNYYQDLKTNTEELGSIFDAQPSAVKGNIHCITSPSDLVLGFVSVSTISTKQFNLNQNSIPLRVPDPYGTSPWIIIPGPPPDEKYYSTYYFAPPDPSSCKYNSFTVSYTPTDIFQPVPISAAQANILAKGDSVVIDRYFTFSTPIIYYYAPKNCVDCRTRGGTNIKPSYFP